MLEMEQPDGELGVVGAPGLEKGPTVEVTRVKCSRMLWSSEDPAGRPGPMNRMLTGVGWDKGLWEGLKEAVKLERQLPHHRGPE